MIVLGINGIDGLFHDSSATLVVDGQIVAWATEEMFNRAKHSSGIPFDAIRYCLGSAGISFSEVDHVGYYLDPDVLEKTFIDHVVAAHGADPDRLSYYGTACDRIRELPEKLAEGLGKPTAARFHFLNHHLCHAASAFYASGYDSAAVLTLDGAGDRETCTLYRGDGDELKKIHDFLVYPNSLGFLYTAFSKHLGFDWISGPGKLMGLAGYGTPRPELFRGVVQFKDSLDAPIGLDLSFFDYHLGGSGFQAKGLERFGAPRLSSEPFKQRHYDLAATVQRIVECAVVRLAAAARSLLPQEKRLCFAGGVALNISANRRILDAGIFENLFVPPPASDCGASMGAALYLSAANGQRMRHRFDVYCGPHIMKDFSVSDALSAYAARIVSEELSEEKLCAKAAKALSEGKIIGWAQGRAECGPRALGHRSILANPIDPRAKDELNARVKKRESFRPYGPSVLSEYCSSWFDLTESPYMLLEANVLPEKRRYVPSIVHVDGTSRPQSVSYENDPRFYRMLQEFYQRTGVPMVLNTSFNRHGEPIICSPSDAIEVLLDTEMDALFLGDLYIVKR